MNQEETEALKEKIKVDGSYYLLSFTALTGKSLKDIQGYISYEFGDPCFKLSRLIFDDDTQMHFEGEHDIAYLTSYHSEPPNIDSETLRLISPREH